jgi:hypothetical protein
MSTANSRRDWCLAMSSAVLVAMEYSQERTELRPSKRSMPFHARTRASCSASSASCTDPSIR